MITGGVRVRWIKTRFAWRRRKRLPEGEVEYGVDLPIALPAFFASGFVAGFFGIGGGVVNVPVLHYVCGMPMHVAVATSLVVISFTSSGSFASHLALGHVHLLEGLLLGLGTALGSQVGPRLARRAREPRLRKAFGVFILCIAARITAGAFL